MRSVEPLSSQDATTSKPGDCTRAKEVSGYTYKVIYCKL